MQVFSHHITKESNSVVYGKFRNVSHKPITVD